MDVHVILISLVGIDNPVYYLFDSITVRVITQTSVIKK